MTSQNSTYSPKERLKACLIELRTASTTNRSHDHVFNEMYEVGMAYAKPLLRYKIKAVARGKEDEVLHDAVVDTLMGMNKTIIANANHITVDSFPEYFITAISNKLIDKSRKLGRLGRIKLATDVMLYDNRSTQNMPNHCLEIASSGLQHDAAPVEFEPELLRAVQRAIRTMSPKSREAFVAFYVDEKSYNQIKDQLRISEGSVKSRLHNARNVLEQSIADCRPPLLDDHEIRQLVQYINVEALAASGRGGRTY